MVVKNNENTICTKCRGRCCKILPGFFHPEDIGEDINKENLKDFIDRGDVSIDWYEDIYSEHFEDDRGYFLRMRIKASPVVDPAFGGECIHLTETGCTLPFEQRPYGCRALTPRTSPNGHCTGAYMKLECAKDWDKYHSIIAELVDDYGGYDPIEYIIDNILK